MAEERREITEYSAYLPCPAVYNAHPIRSLAVLFRSPCLVAFDAGFACSVPKRKGTRWNHASKHHILSTRRSIDSIHRRDRIVLRHPLPGHEHRALRLQYVCSPLFISSSFNNVFKHHDISVTTPIHASNMSITDRGPVIFIVCLVVIVLASVFTALRLISKWWVTKKNNPDDWLVLVAWVSGHHGVS